MDGDPPAPAYGAVVSGCTPDFDNHLVYALDSQHIQKLYVDAVGVYWISDTGVWMLRSTLSDATQLDTDPDATGLVGDAQRIYWAVPKAKTLKWLDRDTLAVHSLSLGASSYAFYSFAIDARYAYIAALVEIRETFDGGSASGSVPSISRVPLGETGPLEPLFTGGLLSPVTYTINYLVAANGSLYWLDENGLQTLTDGAAMPTLLASAKQSSQSTLVVDNRGAFWETYGATQNLVALAFDGRPTSPIDAQNIYSALAIDETYLYWADGSTTSLNRWNRDSGVLSTVPASGGVSAFAVFSDKLYWVDKCVRPAIRAIQK